MLLVFCWCCFFFFFHCDEIPRETAYNREVSWSTVSEDTVSVSWDRIGKGHVEVAWGQGHLLRISHVAASPGGRDLRWKQEQF